MNYSHVEILDDLFRLFNGQFDHLWTTVIEDGFRMEWVRKGEYASFCDLHYLSNNRSLAFVSRPPLDDYATYCAVQFIAQKYDLEFIDVDMEEWQKHHEEIAAQLARIN